MIKESVNPVQGVGMEDGFPFGVGESVSHRVGYPVRLARFKVKRAFSLFLLSFHRIRARVSLASCPPFTRAGDSVRSICFSVVVIGLSVGHCMKGSIRPFDHLAGIGF